MGKRGPAPTPTEILRRRGSRRARSRKGEPAAPSGEPTMPAMLDATARRYWRRLVSDLDSLGVLAKTDRNAMTRYCVTWARYETACAVLAKEGETYEAWSKNGVSLRSRPEVAVVNQCDATLHRLEQEFGLTASARARLAMGHTEEPDEMLTLLKGRFGSETG